MIAFEDNRNKGNNIWGKEFHMYSTLSFLKKTKQKQCSTKSIRNGRQVHFNTRKKTGNDRWLFLFLPLLPSEETTIHPEQKKIILRGLQK